MPASGGGSLASHASSSSKSTIVPKSRPRCSGRSVKLARRSTETTGIPRLPQDSTKRAPMKPAAPVTRSVPRAIGLCSVAEDVREDQRRDDGRIRLDHELRRVHVELPPGDLLVRYGAGVAAVARRRVADLGEVAPEGH